jgi:hypothetical protein
MSNQPLFIIHYITVKTKDSQMSNDIGGKATLLLNTRMGKSNNACKLCTSYK